MATADMETLEGELIETTLDGGGALAALNRSEIDMQVATAKRYPRSMATFKKQAVEMACLDEETAGTMFYALKRGGKVIEGPSVRLAEVVGSAFGNLRYASRVVAIDDKFVTAQGMCLDVEKNIAASVEVKRRITNSSGQRYNDDMITVTSNAACAIALRNAMFKVVPMGLVKPIYDVARQTSIGNAQSLDKRRGALVDWFGKVGVAVEQLVAWAGKKGIEDITTDDLIQLRGLATAIKDGDTTVDEAFGEFPKAGARVKPSDLGKKLQDQPKSEPPEAKTEPANEPEAPDSSDGEIDVAAEEARGAIDDYR